MFADYKIVFLSEKDAGATHDSKAIQSTLSHDILHSNRLPRWAVFVADDAY